MADQLKSIKKNGYYIKRLQCNCLSPDHSLDLSLFFWGDSINPEVAFNERYSTNNKLLWGRIKLSAMAILGREIIDHEFCVREEDIPDVEEFFLTLKAEVANRRLKQNDN